MCATSASYAGDSEVNILLPPKMLETIEFKFSCCNLQALNDFFYSSSDKAEIPPNQCHLTFWRLMSTIVVVPHR